MSGENEIYNITEDPNAAGAFSAVTGNEEEFYEVSSNFPEDVPTPGFVGFQLDNRPAIATLEIYVLDSDYLDSDSLFDSDTDGIMLEVITSGTPNVSQVLVNIASGWCQVHSDLEGADIAALYDHYGANYNKRNIQRLLIEDPQTTINTADIVSLQTINSFFAHTYTAYGATDNKIIRFSTVVDNTGDGVGYIHASTAANGDTWTFNKTGRLFINVWVQSPANAYLEMGVSLNSSELTTLISGIVDADRVSMSSVLPPAASATTASNGCSIKIAVNDIIRIHTNGAVPANADVCGVSFIFIED